MREVMIMDSKSPPCLEFEESWMRSEPSRTENVYIGRVIQGSW